MVRACAGYVEAGAARPCVFNSTRAGRAAQPTPGFRRCLFCDLERLDESLEKPGVRNNVAARLRVSWPHCYGRAETRSIRRAAFAPTSLAERLVSWSALGLQGAGPRCLPRCVGTPRRGHGGHRRAGGTGGRDARLRAGAPPTPASGGERLAARTLPLALAELFFVDFVRALPQ